ncbi:MAG TPA: CpXC domain-containing protein, partial [Roseiflexaceae bacterium]|nr:CpXC domain-containing protein [Roseiflexaceae bacterium]
MSAPAPQVVQLACPNCRTPLRAQIFTLVDVGQQPELKNYLLSGQLNMVACPNCGNVSMLAAPLIYHDPSKQLFFVHFPQQLNASTQDQEKFVGDATSLIMRSLPENMPKGYLLAPRRFLSLNSLIEAVLEADGITKEMIEAQQRRVDLIGQLAEAYEQGEEQLAQLVEQRRADIDYEFMATLTAFAEASVRSQQDESAQILIGLRDKLVELVGFDDEPGDEQDVSLDDALDRLTSVPDEELELAVGELRPLIDYSFFEELTSRIDAATQAGDAETAQRLTSRRQQIVEMVERLDAQAKELFEAGANLLN